jgi:hypothetical protein
VTEGITYSVMTTSRAHSHDEVLPQPPPEMGEVEQDADEQAGHVGDPGDVEDCRVDRGEHRGRLGRELARELLDRGREVGRVGGVQEREPDTRGDRWDHQEHRRGHPPIRAPSYIIGNAVGRSVGQYGGSTPLMYGPAITANSAKKMASVTPVVTLLASASLILPFPAPRRNVSKACPPSMG